MRPVQPSPVVSRPLTLADLYSQVATMQNAQALDWSVPDEILAQVANVLRVAIEYQWDAIDYNADPTDPQAQVVRLLLLARQTLSLGVIALEKEVGHA